MKKIIKKLIWLFASLQIFHKIIEYSNKSIQKHVSGIKLPNGNYIYYSIGDKRFDELKSDIKYVFYSGEFKNTKEPSTIEWIANFKENSCFWDVGANLGSYALFAAGYKNSTCICFEPALINAINLNINLEKNSFSSKLMTSLPICLHDTLEINTLNMPNMFAGVSGSSFGNTLTDHGLTFNPSHRQGSIGINGDFLVANFNLPKPNYIKIDVDGNELNVLKGITNILAGKELISILVELDSARSDLVNECVELLQKHNFALQSSAQGGRSISLSNSIKNYIFKKVSSQ